ncbi:hypothetical protein PC122_g16351 [Phytophthora cactorum]|nr:hypothetical protein PC122_g16351 [Phytophthora cactorum]
MARRLHHVSYILYLLSIISIHGAVLRRTWTTQPWCESVRKPQWPFAYQKTATQTLEWQGRVNPNDQDIRHQCSVFGVQSKCHMCENFACNGDSGDRCAFQFQGVPWSALPKNIPTVTDVPWAVGGQHRYDYGGGTHLCAFLSGGSCLSPFTTDFSQCDVRCWGTASGELTHRGAHPNRNSSDAEASDIWSYSPLFGESGRSQGQVTTVAGEGTAGFLDGPVATAQFNHPRGVAVDSNGVVYVADTANHRIRIIDPTTKMVSTLAGDGIEGFSDGAALSVARFSYPSDVAVLETNSGTSVTVFVADTGNHRIRQIKNGIVTCLSGLCGAGVETVRLSQQPEKPHAGLADGDPLGARFDSPMGVAADADGVIFVADTGNHLIRRIEPDGTTHTVAGGVVPSEDADTPGCLSPCQRGERGFRDGNLTFARFESPRAIAVGAQRTLIVGEGHRVRRVTYDGGPASTIESVTSTNRVVTLAGSNVPGHIDGEGNEATFNAPAGVAFAADGRMYAASSTDCSVRQISPAALVSRAVTCSTRATEMLRPSGCASYEQPVDELFLQTSPTANNIYHNYLQRKEFDPVQGTAIAGRTLKDCTGSPSADGLVQGDLALPLRDPDTQAIITDVFEDLEYGTTIKISCPAACDASSTSKVYGSGLYSDASSICLAAIHSGAIVAAQGGLVTLTLERGAQPAQTAKTMGSTANGVTSLDVPTTQNDRARLFSVKSYLRPKLEVQSIAGAPNAPLGSQQDGCGYLDAQPPLAARFLGIAGLDIARSRSLSRWTGDDSPDVCECASGWSGFDCRTPVCSQGYYSPNQATYLAAEPSTATHPRQAVTNPTYTATIEQIAYTQVTVASETRGGAKRFVLNVASRSSSNFRALRGNYDSATAARNCDTYRCPQYDVELVANDGRSFQTGCSVGDPEPNPKRSAAFTSAQQIQNLLDYRDDLNVARVSDEFLCGNIVWHQGDIESNNGTNRVTRTNYVNVTKVDDVTWEYGISTPGEGVYECFNSGACVAPDECACGDGWTGIDCNTPLCRFQKADKYAGVASGCRNGGVCVSKDQCRCITVKSSLHEHFSTAPTGITGYFGSDCALPICIQGLFDPICNASVVANDLNLTSGNITGIDVMASSIVSSGDGCYRCKNGGLCIAPDVCSCAEGWTGFDCSTPICELPKAVVASVRSTLFTVDELKVETFRTDPCGTKGGRWGKEIVNGAMVGQGNCSLPMKCTCLCRKRYDKKLCASTGELCEKPWQDPFHRSIPPGFVYGTRDCVDGFQGIEDANGNFQTCHLQIYVPSAWRRYTVSFVAILSVLGMIILVAWYYIRKRVRRALLLAKAERRRSRKNSEENLNKPKLGAFTHAKND